MRACGNISKITDDKGNFIQILYYPTGHVKSILKNGKVISEYSYNDDFELISQRNDFINVNYDYDDFGIVNSVLTNHNGNVKYDILGRKNYVVTNSMNQKYQYELDEIILKWNLNDAVIYDELINLESVNYLLKLIVPQLFLFVKIFDLKIQLIEGTISETEYQIKLVEVHDEMFI